MSDNPMQEDGRLPEPGTPLPWVLDENAVHEAQEGGWCKVADCSRLERFGPGERTAGYEVTAANAAYIVWACNNAPDLQADIDRRADLIGKLYEKLDAAVEAGEEVLVGGNHLALLIGPDHPPYTAAPDEALEHYGAGAAYDVWCCWRAIMRFRDIIRGEDA